MSMPSSVRNAVARVGRAAWGAVKSGFSAWLFIVKLTIPAMLITRLLVWFDLIPYVAMLFRPFMAPLGLPPEAALVWVTGMVATNYAAIAVYLSLLPVMGPLTVAQVSLLTCLVLVAHSLLVEGQVCRAAGLSFWRCNAYRVVMALAFGLLIRLSAVLSGWGAGPSRTLAWLAAPDGVAPWGQWLASSAQQLLLMLAVIEALMLLMDLVKYLGLTRLISKFLGPPLRLVGVGEGAIMITIIGCVLGIGYGGGLIVAESRSGRVGRADVFAALMLMGLFHSAVEDTLIMWSLGGTLWCLLAGRLVFAFLFSAAVNRLIRRPFWRRLLAG